MIISKEIDILSPLVEKLKQNLDFREKIEILLDFVKENRKDPKINELIFEVKESEDSLTFVVFLSLLAMKQEDLLLTTNDVTSLLYPLKKVETFYASIGGLVGYHFSTLEKLKDKTKAKVSLKFSPPDTFNLLHLEEKKLFEAILKGIQATNQIGEIYLVGGLGDRLKLKTAEGDPLPVAVLPFNGKSLLELLLRDVFGREYLYYKLFNKKITVPIALMTSLEMENEAHIRNLLKKNSWFGRGEEAFFIFRQVLVPVITEEGDWVLNNEGEPLLHPGGHGMMWKAAEEEGVYNWFENRGKEAFLVRQINNPIAGTDFGLLALLGLGFLEKKTLGIASCEMAPGAAEGVLVNIEEGKEKTSWATINIEYTELKSKSKNVAFLGYPTNTNILFADLKKIKAVIKRHPIPDFLLNMKTKILVKSKEVLSGRLESMMQNITHFLTADKKGKLPVFITFNERRKTIAAVKKSYEEKNGLLETPEGVFYDLMREGYSLLAKKCGVKISPFSPVDIYLKEGPSLLFLYHPALGPLYDIICQKIFGGEIKNHSELQLEIAELLLQDLYLDGSLIIETANPASDEGGRCFLKNIKVINKGIDRKGAATYWRNDFSRREKCHIILKSNSEFFAEDITFVGEQKIIVPPNTRVTAYQKGNKIHFAHEKIEEPTLWKYEIKDQRITLTLPVLSPIKV